MSDRHGCSAAGWICALEHASEDMKNNAPIVMAAVQQTGLAFLVALRRSRAVHRALCSVALKQ